MASEYDTTEFVDTDFQAHKLSASPSSTGTMTSSLLSRAPSREEVDLRVTEAQKKLADLKRAQEELERERASLEELRRRQAELQTGRQEIIQNLTRGVGLLEEAEFTARRDAEQMARTLADFREALISVEAIQEDRWNKDNFSVEITRALTAIENARMEWNSARLKFPILSGRLAESVAESSGTNPQPPSLAGMGFTELCRLGLALTWPLVLVALAALGVFAALWFNR